MAAFPYKIAVDGNGLAALICAVALKRAYPAAEIAIYSGDGELRPEFAGAATPYIHLFHRQIGLDANIFAQRTGAQVINTIDWIGRGRGVERVAALSDMPYPEGVALHQIWLAADDSGRADWHTICQRFQSGTDRAEGHGIRFDAVAYLRLLSEMATHLKVPINTGPVPPNTVFDLVIRTLRGDCTIDQPAVHAPIGQQVSAGMETFDQSGVTAHWSNALWSMRFDDTPQDWQRDAAWSGGVLHIGNAAVSMESCDGHNLCAVMSDIARAISLMPTHKADGPERAEYNRRTSAVHGMLIDWHRFKWGLQPSADAAQFFRQFDHRGRIQFRDEDPVSAGTWINWLLTSGARPERVDPSVTSLDPEQVNALIRGA